jgi:glycosyltransferase involved in cell wall biosynthesis
LTSDAGSGQVFVVSPSPVSGAFLGRLEETAGGPVDVVNLAQLRRLPTRSIVTSLRSHRGHRALVALEDSSSEGILPILHAVATLASPSSIEVVRGDLSRERRGRLQLVAGLGGLARASADGLLAARAARRELADLVQQPRLALRPANLDRALYLNTIMWFGLKAGGSVGHIAGVVNGLAELGLEVTLASATEPSLLRPEVKLLPLTPPPAYAVPFERNFARFQRRVVRLLTNEPGGYGFLYQRMSVGNYAGAVLSRGFGIPLVLEYNGSEVWTARHWGRGLRYEDAALQAEEVSLRHAHLVVTVSEILRDELVERGVEPVRVVWHPNGVDADRYAPRASDEVRSQLGLPRDTLVLGFIGTFGQWHGVEVLARAFADLVREHGDWAESRRVHLLLIGDGLRRPDVEEALHGVPPELWTLTGMVPQADGARYLAAADVLVSPHVPNADGSRFFGSPTKLFEYMAMGRAILASDLEQIGEVLQPSLRADELSQSPAAADDPSVAVLARPGSAEELTAGLRFLVEREDWRARLGTNARARVLERYTWSHHVEAIMEGIRRLGGGGGP